MDAQFVFDWLPLVLAPISAIVLGFIWYHPKVVGTPWMKANGWNSEEEMGDPQMGKAMSLMILGAIFTSFVFYMVTQAFTADTWLHDGNTLTIGMALQGAFFTWLGFIMPMVFSKVTFEKRGMALLWIDGGYYLIQLSIMATIFWQFLK